MEETVGLPYLEALTGKFVRAFKGGPDSREGKLLTVQSDYIVIQTEQNQLVYFAIEHLKIVVGNAKKTQLDLSSINEEETVYPANFLGVLESLQTSSIQVNGGGPASKVGRVVDVKEEFLVISTEKEGLVLYPISHIKSVTVLELAENELLPQFGDGTETINGLLSRLVHNWVSISAGGPNKVEGILMEVTDSHLIVVHHEELFYVTTDHVQFVVITVQVNENGEEEAEGENSANGGSSAGGSSKGSSSSGSSDESSSSSDESSSSSDESSSSSDESSSSSDESSSSSDKRKGSSYRRRGSSDRRKVSSVESSSSSVESSSSLDESSSVESSSSFIESSSSSSSYESSSSSSSNGGLGGLRGPRVNTFKQIWIENLIKATTQNPR
ncbi:spore coat protein B [Bacillus sp. OK838]|nr:spore coat protein B [Bacillus sp. OK838]